MFIGCAGIAKAETTQLDKTTFDDFIAVTHYEDSYNAMVTQMVNVLDSTLRKQIGPKLPPETRQECKDVFFSTINTGLGQTLKETASFEKIKPFLASLLKENFTDKEIQDMTAFYRTPTGQKAILKLPELMKKGAEYAKTNLINEQEIEKSSKATIQKAQNAIVQCQNN
jgi:hypothetical protein